MSIDIENGYYVVSWGKGGAHGPKARELSDKAFRGESKFGAASLRVDLVHSTPKKEITELYPSEKELFEEIKAYYGLLRYHDPSEQWKEYEKKVNSLDTKVWEHVEGLDGMLDKVT